MIYTELFKYKHKTYNWIARNNGVMGGDVFFNKKQIKQ